MNVGRTAPGIVFERLIKGLSENHKLDVLTSDYDPSYKLSEVRNILQIKRKYIHPRIHKLLISIFGINPFDWLWSKKAISLLNKKKYKDYDLVFSLISFHHYTPLIAGVLYTKNHPSKLAVHSLDAIPAPIGWSKNDSYFKGVKRMMGKYLPKSDFFFTTNEQMLKYQLSTFIPKNDIITEVIYNPSYGKLEYYNYSMGGKNTFLYTGGLYGLRKPEYVLGAFKKILKEFPDSILEFVGSHLSTDYFSIFSSDEREKIIIHPFNRDLSEYYERATALIDIDADLPDDVFLSSKIVNYITINRIIITETGENSPSRELFKGIPSVLQCGHNIDELAAAMKEAIQQQGKVNFSDRATVISLFDLTSVINKLNNKIRI